jgi:hypothetical protein
LRPSPQRGRAFCFGFIISVPCLALGLVLLIHEGLSIRKLEALAEEEEKAVTLEKSSANLSRVRYFEVNHQREMSILRARRR